MRSFIYLYVSANLPKPATKPEITIWNFFFEHTFGARFFSLFVAQMNREIASAPGKSEADFCARRTAVISQQRRRTVHTPPDWLLKRVYGGERGKREKTARRLGARALNVCMLERLGAPRACHLYFSRNNPTTAERPDNRRSVEHFYYSSKLTKFLTQNYQTKILNHNPSPKGGR